jgi:hypothetical protein
MRRPAVPNSKRSLALLALVVALALALWSGCGRDESSSPTAPGLEAESIRLSASNPAIQAVMAIQETHTPALMQDLDIVGTATGLTEDGRPAVLVFAADDAAASRVPATLDGVPVVTTVTGRLRAMKGGSGVSHTAIQTPPISLGTSGGWRYDLANGFCCGGTLGSLINKGGTQHILSNWHVLYSDIVNGGNSRTAQPGDPVIQPGLIDVNCNANNAQNVATLVANGGSLPGNNVDAGIAAVIPGMVKTDGSILEVGTISSSTVGASMGQAVKKSGRTTALSRSSINGLNGTVTIGYDNECAGGAAFNQTYTGQIIIANARCKFLDGGDSGSLMVEDVSTNPQAVGLLFAGSVVCSRSAIAIANPIDDVLNFFNATMVGN